MKIGGAKTTKNTNLNQNPTGEGIFNTPNTQVGNNNLKINNPDPERFKFIGEGLYANYSSLEETEIVNGLINGRFKLQFIGELYPDYSTWGLTYANYINVYSRSYCEEEEKGHFIEGRCFITGKKVVAVWRKEWLRKSDRKLIYDYYYVLQDGE